MKKSIFIICCFLVGFYFYRDTSDEHLETHKKEDLSRKIVSVRDDKILVRSPSGKKSIKVQKMVKVDKSLSKTSHPMLDQYPRTNLNFESLYVVSNIFADYYPKPFQKISEVGGFKVYESFGEEKKNVLFDSSRGLYCAWTGIVSLSADTEVLIQITERFPLKFLETTGAIQLLESSDEFDLVKHLPQLMSMEGVGDVSLDLTYAKLEAK
jgi:hypothetical protein